MTWAKAKRDFERRFLERAIRNTDSLKEAAKVTGLNRTHLYKRLTVHGLKGKVQQNKGTWAQQGL